MRRILSAVIASLAGLLMLADFLFRNEVLDQVGAILSEGVMVIGACALIAGVANLLSVHGKRAARRERNWPHSLTLLVSLFVILVVGIAGISGPGFAWIFRYVYSPLQATIFSLLAFLVVTAAYRALRVSSRQGAVLVVTSLFLLIAQIPGISSLWSRLPVIRDWIVGIPVTAAMRGLILGIALGSITAGLRVLFWADRPHLN